MIRIVLYWLRILCVLPLLVNASDTSSLVNKITQAQKSLTTTENIISKQRQNLAAELNKLEKEVLALREKTAIARRLSDAKTLSLSKLEQRLESWRQQQVYQQNLIHRFLQQYGDPVLRDASSQSGDSVITHGITQVITLADSLQQSFMPGWRSGDVILPSGEINVMPVLNVGPVTWYWDAELNRAGMASQHSDALLHSEFLLTGDNSNTLEDLREKKQGNIVFDPTLTRALAQQKNAESLLEHLMKGGLWAVPIMLFALFALSIALFKAYQLWRLPTQLRFTPSALKTALTDINSPLTAHVDGMQKTLLNIARNKASSKQNDDQLFMQLQDDKQWLERWIGGIAITAAVSPLLGLLGTVSGMIETFKMMTLFGSGDPEVVSGGIAQALVTTELGLVVAIPALILNAVLSRRAKNYYNELESFAILLSKANEETDIAIAIQPQAHAKLESNHSNLDNHTQESIA